MAAKPLGCPPPELARDAYPKTYFQPHRLVRVSSYHTGEPYFGRSGNNRFDAPLSAAGLRNFGVCYFGTSLDVAIAESILHDEESVNGRFHIARSHV